MTAEELAARLDGMEYGSKIDSELLRLAEESNLVIVRGYSDDGMRIEGAVREDVGCFDGGEALFDKAGLVISECDEGDRCPYFKGRKESAAAVEALWCEDADYSWTYRTKVPLSKFEVFDEGNEPYCRGIVFHLGDLPR